MTNKKGVELTLNTIIIAAICLIVLVVVIIIFTNAMGQNVTTIFGLTSCPGKGGTCVPTSAQCQDGTAIYKYGGCGKGDQGDWCCLPDE